MSNFEQVHVPTTFAEMEMKNPKRRTGFAFIGRNTLNKINNRNIGKQKIEEILLEDSEQKVEKEFKLYQDLVILILLRSLKEWE
jgi:hypothetical protein